MDNPDQPITLKAFHAKIINDAAKINRERATDRPVPQGPEAGKQSTIHKNYLQIKQDVQDIVNLIMKQELNEPGMENLFAKK